MTTKMMKIAILPVVGGLCLAAAACGDDDDDDGNMDAGVDAAGSAGSGGTGGTAGSGGTGGVAAGPRGMNNPPMLGAQIDRLGRPAISTALIETFNADDNAKRTGKDAYNAAAPAAWSTFVPRIRGSLAILDALDGRCGNQLAADGMNMPRYTFLATVLADDQLYVNAGSGKCGVYLGVEAELVVPNLPDAAKGSCGGRTPNDDVIERSYSVLAAGVLSGVDDTVAKDDATHDLATFPWLAAPTQ